MLTSSSPASPAVPRPRAKQKAPIATPQTSHALNKSHRLLRPLKSKLVSLRQFYESNPSTRRAYSVWSSHVWPPTSRIPARSYGGRRKRTRSGNNNHNNDDETPKPVWEEALLTDIVALNFARDSVPHASIANMFATLHSSYRIFIQQLQSACSMDTLGQIATYELGTWTYLYEKQSTAQHTETPSDDPIITLDDVLLEYLPPTHPHLPLLLGYMTALIKDFTEVIQPLLPSLIFLTRMVSRRATLDLTHCLFEVAEYGWEDFSLCMAISRLIGREDEYLLWLSRHMNWGFIHQGAIGHLLRLGRDYPSLAALTLSIVQICVPRKRTSMDPNLEAVLTELILLVCTHSIQSGSAKQLIPLASALPPQHTPLPSLSLLLHLIIKSYCPNHSNTVLYPLVNRNVTFALLRQVLPSATLKSRLTELFTDPLLAPLAMAISRDWKDHIDYDDESDNFESTQEFLERVEREYLTATEGVKWRFEDVLAEWIGEWPDGRQMGSMRVPRTRRIAVVEEDDEEEVDDDDDEFGGSLVKREVPRSGLVMDTPVPSRGVDPRTERRAVLEKLFKLSSTGRTGTRERVIDRVVDEDVGGSFLDRLGLGQVPLRNNDKTEMMSYGRGTRRNHKRRSILSDNDDDTSVYKDSSSETHSTRNVSRKRQRRRRIDDSDDESDEIISGHSDNDHYEDEDDDEDIENQSVQLDSDINPATSDVDELSISIDTNRSALKGITLNKTTRYDSRRSSMRTPKKSLVRESSPVLMDEVSEDELAL